MTQKIVRQGMGGRNITQKKKTSARMCMICKETIVAGTELYELDNPTVIRGKFYRKGIAWFCLKHEIPKEIEGEKFLTIEEMAKECAF